jgi:thiol-disulfide isomerase/thioredoxin
MNASRRRLAMTTAATRSVMGPNLGSVLRGLGLSGGASAASAASAMPAVKVERWVNTTPLTADMLRGKVVLVDFWEYTCINWIRTLPYVKAWHREYADRGLVVVGVHAPEFEFGKRAENIDRGIRDHGLTYPIALDNEFVTWRAFGNNAWPAKYLFDAHGTLVKRWVGEGSYSDIEAEIRRLLVAASPGTRLPAISPEATAFAKTDEPSYLGITAETYLGAERRERGAVRLEGNWQSSRQYVELQNGTGRIVLPFTAGEVNLVVHPGPAGKAAVAVMLDGKPIGEPRGADVGPDGVARFDRPRMIRLVARAPRGKHVLTLVASDPGLQLYAFTFGPLMKDA